MGNERNASSGKRKAKAFPISLTIANPVGAPQPGDQHLMDTEKGTRDRRTGNDIFGGAGSLLQRITTESTRRVEERKRKRLMDDSFGPDATKQKTVEVGQDETTVPSSRSGGSGSGGQLEESRTPQAPVGMPIIPFAPEEEVSEDYRHALEIYPSVRDVEFPPIENLNELDNGDVNFEHLVRAHPITKEPILKGGDVLEMPVAPDLVKYIMISGGITNRRFPGVVQHGSISSCSISVPSGDRSTINGRNPGVTFPSANRPDSIRSPKAMWEAARTVLSPATQQLGGPAATKVPNNLWDIEVFRNDVNMGSLYEMRLALQLSLNEALYETQLTFTKKREKNTPPSASKAGFYLHKFSGLYLKVPNNKVAGLNKDLLIDFGDELNEELASLAVDGHKIFMVDMRVLNTDGLPVPPPWTLADLLQDGPEKFSNQFLRKLAGCCGWTNGYAHQGLSALCAGQSDFGLLKYAYRRPNKATPVIDAAEETLWTPDEQTKVGEFHDKKLEGHSRHYPIPRNQSGRHFGITTTQYRKVESEFEESWKVDRRVHGHLWDEEIIPNKRFQDARVKNASEGAASRVTANRNAAPAGLGEDWAPESTFLGYETAGRAGPSRSGRNSDVRGD